MENNLPYIYVDEEYYFNISLLALIINSFGMATPRKYFLDLDKMQFFIYLVKNPSKINIIMNAFGKAPVLLNETQTYTIESISVNIDILFDRAKMKYLLKMLAKYGMLGVTNHEGALGYHLTPHGRGFACSLNDDYFKVVVSLIDILKPLNSLPSSKLLSFLNKLFKGES